MINLCHFKLTIKRRRLWSIRASIIHDYKGLNMNGKHVFFKLEFPKEACLPPLARILARHDGTFYPLTETITESLFDKYIDALIKELEEIRREGKRKFAAWQPIKPN